ncbi:MAG: hypothetical protein WDW38_002740 [Sanguina aurantia]
MVRFKNRYLLLELLWKDQRVDTSLGEAALQQLIRDSIQLNFGDYGAACAQASVQVKYFNPYTNLCILRCETSQLQQVRKSVSL